MINYVHRVMQKNMVQHMNKITYVVSTSEDGILGAYTNKKLAYEKALSLIAHHNYKVISYSKVCKKLNPKDYYFAQVDIIDDYDADTEVTIHLIEQNIR